jgi:hypothetical protein
MKTYSINCKVTGTIMEYNLTFAEVRKVLTSYYLDDYGCDIEEIIRYCENYKIDLFDYFINDHFYYYDDIMPLTDRYEVYLNSASVDITSFDIKNWADNWFYNKHNSPIFEIDDTYGKTKVIGWKALHESLNWDILNKNEIALSLLHNSFYKYKDFCDSFTIRIL